MMEMRTCRLDGPGTTLVLASLDQRLPICVYWGKALPDSEDLNALAQALAPPLPGGTLDMVPEPSLCPEQGRAYPGESGVKLADAEGLGLLTQFRMTNMHLVDQSLEIEATDSINRAGLSFHLAMDEDTGVVTASSRLDNQSDQSLQLLWLTAPSMPPPSGATHFLDYVGRWTQELCEQWVPFTRGVHSRESKRGRPGHDHFPGLVVAPPDGSDGDAYGWHLGWSGNHRLMVEELPDGRRLVQFGEALEPGEIVLPPGQSYQTPPLYIAFASDGMDGLANAFQSHVRGSILSWPDPNRPRPVHYNGWEAVYFDHDLERLKLLAEKAANLGAERFVLDDGWFRGRNDDTTNLGDWYVDAEKFPDGLQPLIDHVQRQGMTFGLWVEPEMVNPISDLAEKHPDWVMAPPAYQPILGRSQHVLDLTNPAVTDYLFARLHALLSDHRIDYLKWDMNRDLALALDREGRALGHRQTEALYALLSRLRDHHPKVEIESCASGGARLDYGMLGFTQRVWLSDSNDAHERWRMQHAAMTFLPPEIIGSHVGPRICHTSGRQIPMAFRAAVALTGHMGFEMDLDELTKEETETLKAATVFYKTHRDMLHTGRQYRLGRSDPAQLTQMRVAKDRNRFLLFHGVLASSPNEGSAPLCLKGLDPHRRYHLKLVNPEILEPGIMRGWPSPLFEESGLTLTGATLMSAGIRPPILFPHSMLVIEGNSLSAK